MLNPSTYRQGDRMVYEPSLEFEGWSANESQQLTRIETACVGRESCKCNRPGGPFPGNSEGKDQQNSVTCVSTPCTEIYMCAYCLYYIWNDVVDAAG